MARAFTRKRPTGNGSFSWSRQAAPDGTVVWRLFRRDQRNALHCKTVSYPPREQCELVAPLIAAQLRAARHQLRNTVDEIDLALMGVTQ